MAYSNPLQGSPDAAELRKKAGKWLQEARQKAGITQNELRKLVGLEHPSQISQVERGEGRVPPERLEAWARAVKMDHEEFVRSLLRYYDPFVWKALFGGRKRGEK